MKKRLVELTETELSIFRAGQDYCEQYSNLKIEGLKQELTKYKAACEVLRDNYEFLLTCAEYLHKDDIQEGMCPTFYHTLTYQGDLELINKTKRAREAAVKAEEILK